MLHVLVNSRLVINIWVHCTVLERKLLSRGHDSLLIIRKDKEPF